MFKKIKKIAKWFVILSMVGLLVGQLFGGGGMFYYIMAIFSYWVLSNSFKKVRGSNQYITKWRL